MVALLTITILTLICATSLHITSQNANATTQTASWQQSLAGAEGAVDQAMSELNERALNEGHGRVGILSVERFQLVSLRAALRQPVSRLQAVTITTFRRLLQSARRRLDYKTNQAKPSRLG